MTGQVCGVCESPLPSKAGSRGRAAVYCSAACRQRAYRSRRDPAPDVDALIAEVGRVANRLTPRPAEALLTDLTSLTADVGRLRRIAQLALRSEEENVTPEPVTETVDEVDFAERIEQHQRELRVHCYRMVGSYDDAEDLVQETFLRAWRGREGFEGRSSFRAWLYRIATNTCLDFLRRNKRVPRPYDPLPDVDQQGEPPQFMPWLQPFPDDSAEIAETRETMELVFLAAIQHLPPKQRAVVILNDVLGWKAAETADLLETSVASVTSALQRARPTLRERLPERRADWVRTAQVTEEEQAILRRYMAAATGNGDSRVMAELLREDVLVTMPPNPLWFSGRDVFLDFVAQSLDPASPTYFGEWKHLPTSANRLPAAAGYVRRPGTRVYRAQVLDVLRIEDGKVVEITAFEPHLFPAFGLPLTLT
ncbi:RNA polymerase, sigma subunit, ECF family [Amycolatopsis lurida]|uniref:RNA polymerase sigma factor n=1 Tax=Amycolatopsis lurida NRRL 2430 TaxID=1460371 RepID=A0A2P2FJ51_AMYLU|nr:sigma-70 family RNA polymerase sigma factor [Amycolatopsis lurida]KFU76767.1 RNA polymerase subunit sigma-70 [Amycolatopsis lurida NRRL 2430]SEB38580.1 RNA polymerase, sigma subunit, ECF family [Amycolatopsis lurida]